MLNINQYERSALMALAAQTEVVMPRYRLCCVLGKAVPNCHAASVMKSLVGKGFLRESRSGGYVVTHLVDAYARDAAAMDALRTEFGDSPFRHTDVAVLRVPLPRGYNLSTGLNRLTKAGVLRTDNGVTYSWLMREELTRRTPAIAPRNDADER